MEFKKVLEILLVVRGMKQKELGEKIGMSAQGISQLKQSKRPKPATIKKLAAALDVPAEKFLTLY